ncbi:Transcription factor MYB24 [Golovinomyces cichoracearum]|uniref:Transcription factor MYB24 n=1 Tax=Golovinomyces cichoracearum TaxID=62708 RepID=A0A420ITV6_9PEZI|nr:Transcription factor MYB24 [Golovinomyces cichoracearum]
MASHRRGPWSQLEDAYLCQLVNSQGPLNWVRIASTIGSRSPKQCRERYHQNLKPTLNHEPISPEEGVQIERMVAAMGKRWAEIARRLQNRSDNAVKNWWNGSMNRRRRHFLRQKSSISSLHSQVSTQSHNYDERDHPKSFSQSRDMSTKFHRSYSSHQSVNGVMTSPTVSEASRPESVDEAPSLVSDAGSALSFSPKTTNSPGLELPPISYQSRDSRRPSLPGLPSQLNKLSPVIDNHSLKYGALDFSNDLKIQTLSIYSPEHNQNYQQQYFCNPSTTTHHPQVSKTPYFHVYSDLSVQLPPIRTGNKYETPIQTAERDSRMHLSSLLG